MYIFGQDWPINILNGTILQKKKVERNVIYDAIFGVTGIALVFGKEFMEVTEMAPLFMGLGLVIISADIASVGGVISIKAREEKIPLLQSMSTGMFYGAILSALGNTLWGQGFHFELDATFVLSLLHFGILGSAISMTLYIALVHRIGQEKAGCSMIVIPVMALVLSSIVEGYQWTSLSILGIVAILFGSYLVLRKPKIEQISEYPFDQDNTPLTERDKKSVA